MNTHLTDFEIQQLAETANTEGVQWNSHIETCARCKAKYAMYKLLFEEIHISPVPVVPPGFQVMVMEAAAKKQERKIMFYYRILSAAATIGSLMVMPLVLNGNVVKIFSKYHTDSPGTISGLEAALALAAIAFFYICLNGYKTRSKKSNLLADITF